MGLRDLVLFHIVAIIGLRWLLTAGRIGPSSIILWIVAVVLFFIPQGLAVSELSARMPEEGGIYVWTREAFGPLHGFLSGWAYWVNNLIYYPTLIIFIAGNAVFVLGKQYAGLADNTFYQVGFSLVILWLAMGLNIIGLRTGRWVQNTGGIATWIAVTLLVVFAAAALVSGHGQNPFSAGSILPDLSGSTVGLWSSLCFALAGLELAAVVGGEVKDPSRTLPRSIFVAAPLIALVYIVGTLSVLSTFGASDVDLITGVVEAIGAAGEQVGFSLTRIAAALIVLAGLGGVGAWLAGTARIPFVIGLDRYLPRSLGKIHPRWKTPHVALLVQGVGATVFIVIGSLGATVEEAYLVLVDTTIIVYFIPYLYLFLALPVLRRRATQVDNEGFSIPWGRFGLGYVAIAGFVTTAVSIVLATLPTEDVASPTLFVLKVVGGAVGLMAVGPIFYFVAARRGRQATA